MIYTACTVAFTARSHAIYSHRYIDPRPIDIVVLSERGFGKAARETWEEKINQQGLKKTTAEEISPFCGEMRFFITRQQPLDGCSVAKWRLFQDKACCIQSFYPHPKKRRRRMLVLWLTEIIACSIWLFSSKHASTAFVEVPEEII